jgi:hypothetical protein
MDNPFEDMENAHGALRLLTPENQPENQPFTVGLSKKRLTELLLGRYSCRHEQIPANRLSCAQDRSLQLSSSHH